MPYDEFLGWQYYFSKNPVDWRDDLRTYYFIRTQGEKKKPWDVFPTLEHLKPTTTNSLKNSRMMQLLEGAKGGSKIPT